MNIFGYTIIKDEKLNVLIENIVDEHEKDLRDSNRKLVAHLDAEHSNLETIKGYCEEAEEKLQNLSSSYNENVAELTRLRALYKEQIDKNYKLEEENIRKDDMIRNLSNELYALKNKRPATRRKKTGNENDKQA